MPNNIEREIIDSMSKKEATTSRLSEQMKSFGKSEILAMLLIVCSTLARGKATNTP